MRKNKYLCIYLVVVALVFGIGTYANSGFCKDFMMLYNIVVMYATDECFRRNFEGHYIMYQTAEQQGHLVFLLHAYLDLAIEFSNKYDSQEEQGEKPKPGIFLQIPSE